MNKLDKVINASTAICLIAFFIGVVCPVTAPFVVAAFLLCLGVVFAAAFNEDGKTVEITDKDYYPLPE